MLFHHLPVDKKRAQLKQAIQSKQFLRFPGAFNPYIALLIESYGFEGVYISGGALAAQMAWPDVGLTTLSEVAQQGNSIAKSTRLPCIIDADTGFGEEMNVARTIFELEDKGLCGCHIEDQIFPKRCGHLDNKELLSTNEMIKKIKSAVYARNDPNFLIIARTDAKQSEGIEGMINRAKAYLEAGADMIFPEALSSEKEYETVGKALGAPLLANMTEFGKTPILTTQSLENYGFSLVIYPVTTFRLAMKAIEKGLSIIKEEGSQEKCIEDMHTRKRLYEILEYSKYQKLDESVFNF